jgi:hypothetical protein
MKGKSDKVLAGGVRGLSWESRPETIKDLIDAEFNKVSNSFAPAGGDEYWGSFNGREEYRIADVDEYKWIEKIILDNYAKGNKKMTFMDVGAGNFSWGMAVAKFINSNMFFAHLEELEVTIYSFRGEGFRGEGTQKESHMEEITVGRCQNINCGMFKIENMEEELKKRGIEIKGDVDLVVSAQCFRHLVDPVGTLLQIYNQLRDDSGLMFIDTGFAIEGYPDFIVELLANGSFSFFKIRSNSSDMRQNFDALVIQKSGTVHTIPLQYRTKIEPRYKRGESHEKGSKVNIGFDRLAGWSDEYKYEEIESFDFDYLFPKSDDNKALKLFEDFSYYDQVADIKEKKLLDCCKVLTENQSEEKSNSGGKEQKTTSQDLLSTLYEFIRDYPERGHRLLQNIITIKGEWLESIQSNNSALIGRFSSLEWKSLKQNTELQGCMIENTPVNYFNNGKLDGFLQRALFRHSDLQVIQRLIGKPGINLNKLMGLCKNPRLVAEKKFTIMLQISKALGKEEGLRESAPARRNSFR